METQRCIFERLIIHFGESLKSVFEVQSNGREAVLVAILKKRKP